jgi:hypothetical protein
METNMHPLDTLHAFDESFLEDTASPANAIRAILKAEKFVRQYNRSPTEPALGEIVELEWCQMDAKNPVVELAVGAISRLTETRGWVTTTKDRSTITYVGAVLDVEYAMYVTSIIHETLEACGEYFIGTDQYKMALSHRRGNLKYDHMRENMMDLWENMAEITFFRRETERTEPGAPMVALTVSKRIRIAGKVGTTGGKLRRIKVRKGDRA